VSEPTVAELQAKVALLERALRLAAGDFWVLGKYGVCPKGRAAGPGHHELAKLECSCCNRYNVKDEDLASCWCEYYLTAAKEVIPQ